MCSHSPLNKEKFWATVKYLIHMKRPLDKFKTCQELGLESSELQTYISLLKKADYKSETMQAMLGKSDGGLSNETKDQLTRVRKLLINNEVLGPSEKLESVLEAQLSAAVAYGMPSFLEESIVDEATLELSFANGNQLTILPRKVVFLDGHLSLIGETLENGCLSCLGVHEIAGASESNRNLSRKFSRMEVEDFVSGLRAVGENEIRLVLKIRSRVSFDSNLKRQHFANQCMVTNPMGDLIWGASVEPSDEIYAWVESLGSDVEILDPLSFKKGFLEYCEAKLKKLA